MRTKPFVGYRRRVGTGLASGFTAGCPLMNRNGGDSGPLKIRHRSRLSLHNTQ